MPTDDATGSSAALGEAPRRAVARVAIPLTAAVAITLGVAWSGPPREAVPTWLLGLALSATCLALAGRALVVARPATFTAWVLGGALALRLAAWAAPVSLSDDVHRYVWDGTLLASGHDPFATRPRDAVGLAPPLTDASLAQLNSPDFYSVYPPLAQLGFASGGGAALVGLDGARTLRLVFLGADLVAIFALLGLLRRLRRPAWLALLYAWSPLVAWEIAGGGHTEALMLPALIFAASAALDDRPSRAGLLLGLAASAKLTALIALPALVVFVGRRLGWGRALGLGAISLLVLTLSFAPFASPHLLPHVGESLALYTGRFSFNAPIYYGARALLGYREGITPPVDATLMPWLTGASVLAIAALALSQDGRRARLALAIGGSFAAYLLLSRVAHPWYFLPVIAFGATARAPALVLLGGLSALSYLRYDPLGHESPWVMTAELVPVALVVLIGARWPGPARATPEPVPAAR